MAHRVAPEVELELDNIWYYVAKASGSTESADRVIDTITERLYVLACYPNIGRHREEDFGTGLRSVLILHVFRGSRDIEALLRQ